MFGSSLATFGIARNSASSRTIAPSCDCRYSRTFCATAAALPLVVGACALDAGAPANQSAAATTTIAVQILTNLSPFPKISRELATHLAGRKAYGLRRLGAAFTVDLNPQPPARGCAFQNGKIPTGLSRLSLAMSTNQLYKCLHKCSTQDACRTRSRGRQVVLRGGLPHAAPVPHHPRLPRSVSAFSVAARPRRRLTRCHRSRNPRHRRRLSLRHSRQRHRLRRRHAL